MAQRGKNFRLRRVFSDARKEGSFLTARSRREYRRENTEERREKREASVS
jgi:hypothetical protein